MTHSGRAKDGVSSPSGQTEIIKRFEAVRGIIVVVVVVELGALVLKSGPCSVKIASNTRDIAAQPCLKLMHFICLEAMFASNCFKISHNFLPFNRPCEYAMLK